MYSLNKCKSIRELQQWLKYSNVSDEDILIITPKFDGISLVVEGIVGDCWTRGDGEVGQKSNNHLACMIGSGYTEQIITFGEAIMSKENFKKYSDKYANPRNLVAGLFNRGEPGSELKDVDYIRYGSDGNEDKINQIGRLNLINKIECKYLILRAKEFFQHNSEFLEESLTVLFNDWGKDYQIDGLVIDINSKDLRDKLGREENLNPKYARAYKNPKWSGTVEVKVTGVTWQVSKQGKMKPVIQIEPTAFGGVTISNVTGYNAAYIIDNHIAVDSVIEITRSGDVIPKHLNTISYDDFEMVVMMDKIATCPCCDGQTKWDETMTELICSNSDCEEQKIMKLVHFFNTLEIEEFGEPSIRKFYGVGCTTVYKILNATKENILIIPGLGLSSANKLRTQFDRLYYTGILLAKLIDALDVMQGKVGEKTIQLILDNLPEERIQFGHSSVSDLIKINGIAEITATIYLEGIRRYAEVASEFINIIKVSHIQTPKAEVKGNKWEGAKICFTGVRPSKEQEKEIQEQGGEVVSGVSKNTTHLVVKDLGSSSSKMEAAKKLGIQILTLNKL
jgi:DNA ligase (NAD+)